jgi:hypothetical protein
MDFLIENFVSVTNTSSNIAREYLALARDDLELALSMWFDTGTTQQHQFAEDPVPVPSMPKDPTERSTALLAEIHAELATIECDISEVGNTVRGLERNPSEEYILVRQLLPLAYLSGHSYHCREMFKNSRRRSYAKVIEV